MNNQADKDHQDNCNNTNSGIDSATNYGTTKNRFINTSSLNSSKSNNDDDIKEIGITFASDRHLNTIDSFWFALKPGVFVRPFDFVTIDYLRQDTKTIGIIQDIQTIASNQGHIASFDKTDKSRDFLNRVTNEAPGNKSTTSDYDFQYGINVVKVVVIANSEYKDEGLVSRMSTTGMPVGLGRSVRFSTTEEVTFALGVPEMIFPIPAGIIEMSNG